jgi:hypothetical protein
MPRNYFVDVRRQTKNQLLEYIKEHSEWDKKRILAQFSLRTGLKVSTLEVYYNELFDAGMIE